MICLTLALAGLFSASDPWDLLRRAEQSRNLPSEGVVRTTMWSPRADGRVRTMGFHFRQGKDFREMFPENRDGPTILETDGHFAVIGSHGKRILERMLPPDQGHMDLELMRSNYEIAQEGEAQILGRRCAVIRLRPRHPAGSGQRLWIDETTGAILGRDQYDSRGQLLRRTRTEALRFLSQDIRPTLTIPPRPAASATSLEAHGPVPLDQASRWIGFAIPVPKAVPAGFDLRGIFPETCPDGSHSLRMSWSDGLSNINVFLHPNGCRRPMTPPQPTLRERLRHWFHLHGSGHRPPPPPMVAGSLGATQQAAAIGDLQEDLLLEILKSMGTPERPFVRHPFPNHPPKEEP